MDEKRARDLLRLSKKRRRPVPLWALALLLAAALYLHTRSRQEPESSTWQGRGRTSRTWQSVQDYDQQKSWRRKKASEQKYANAMLTIHKDAGSHCTAQWFKSRKACRRGVAVVSPLDLLWTWQNRSTVQHAQWARKADLAATSPGPVATKGSDLDSLKYSLRSCQRHLMSGFNDAAIVVPDTPEEGARDAIPALHNLSMPLLQAPLAANITHRIEASSNILRALPKALTSRLRQNSKEAAQSQGSLVLYDEVGNARTAAYPLWLSRAGTHAAQARIIPTWALACQGEMQSVKSRTSHTKVSRQLSARLTAMRNMIGRPVHGSSASTSSSRWFAVASYACKKRVLPTFDTHVLRAIAAEYKGVGAATLLLQGHHFIGRPMSSSDFVSPLYGPVLRFSQAGVQDAQTLRQMGTTAETNEQSEANGILGARFGRKDRLKLLDLPTVIVQDIATEVRAVFKKDLALKQDSTAQSIDFAFFCSHYMVERHREALLWSFLVARHDANGDDKYSSRELRSLLSEMGLTYDAVADKTAVHVVQRPARARVTIPGEYVQQHREALVSEPRLSNVYFTSLDGTLSSRDAWAMTRIKTAELELGTANTTALASHLQGQTKREACRLAKVCFAPLLKETRRPSEFFKHVAFSHWGCGDCIVDAVLERAKDQGLESFLPAADLLFPRSASALQAHQVPTLPQMTHFERADFSLAAISDTVSSAMSRRLDFVLHLLSRYQYALADADEAHSVVHLRENINEKSAIIELTKDTPGLFSLVNFAKDGRRKKDATIATWLNLFFADPLGLETDTR